MPPVKYLSVGEYLMGRATMADLTPEQVGNLNTLIPKINELLERYGKPWKLNSGYRTPADQQRINPKAPRSKHTLCAAVDLADKDKSLTNWCILNIKVLEELGLYLEDPSHTISWLHIQCIPPRSGYRIFIP